MRDLLLDEIMAYIDRRLGLRVNLAEPVRRGYLNEKWLLHTDRGVWFAKSYHPDRYRKYADRIRDELALALRMQAMFFEAGGSCPELLPAEDGGYIHALPSGRTFVVMSGVPGENVPPGTLTEAQMYELGMETAEMHRAWNDLPQSPALPSEPAWKPDIRRLTEEWEQAWARHQDAPDGIREGLLRQKAILDAFDPRSLDTGLPGWTHLDLWADNLLFLPDRLAAIVDFDRVKPSYPALDLGRVVLSCVLQDGTFRRDAAAAFAEGYRKHRPLPPDGLLHAVRFSWLTESFWWIRQPAASWSAAPLRFQQEMLWTASEWDRLDVALGGL